MPDKYNPCLTCKQPLPCNCTFPDEIAGHNMRNAARIEGLEQDVARLTEELALSKHELGDNAKQIIELQAERDKLTAQLDAYKLGRDTRVVEIENSELRADNERLSKLAGKEHLRAESLQNDGEKKIRELVAERDQLREQQQRALDLADLATYIQRVVNQIRYNCNMGDCDCWEDGCPDSDDVACDFAQLYRDGQELLKQLVESPPPTPEKEAREQ